MLQGTELTQVYWVYHIQLPLLTTGSGHSLAASVFTRGLDDSAKLVHHSEPTNLRLEGMSDHLRELWNIYHTWCLGRQDKSSVHPSLTQLMTTKIPNWDFLSKMEQTEKNVFHF